jgi:DNA-binding CsgD family transcriptional regulator
VQEAIALLPDRQREVVVARHLEGRRPPEIAAALGLSVGAVDSLLLRARRRLATNYEHVLAEGAPVAPTAAVAPTVTTSGAVVASVGHSGPMAGLPHAVGGIVREAVVALPQAPSVLPAPVRRAVATLAAMAVAPVLSTLPAPSSTLPGPAGPPAALSAPPAGTFPTMAAAPPQPIDRALPVAPETLVPAAAGSAAGLASSLLEAAAAPVLPTGAATAATAALDPPGPGGRPTPLPLPVPVPVPVPVPEAAGLPAGSGPGGAPALPTVPSLPPVPAVPALPAIPVPSTGTAPAVPALPLPALPLPLPTQPLVPVPAPAPPSSPPG